MDRYISAGSHRSEIRRSLLTIQFSSSSFHKYSKIENKRFNMSEESRQPQFTNASAPFPTPKSTTPFWRTELDDIDEYKSTDEFPEACDIVIIGSGLSGASTAYFLLNDDNTSPPPSVVLLEARQVCSGATGRNGEPKYFTV